MIAGGAESTVSPARHGRLLRGARAVDAQRRSGGGASRPWDRDRDGFVLGEGAGVLVLEEYEHAKARGARIYCELAGYGMSADAHHITAPPEDGDGARRSMTNALRNGRLNADRRRLHQRPRHLDAAGRRRRERRGQARLRRRTPTGSPSVSTKSMTGHLLGAAGGVEAVFTVLALRDQVAPPTTNLFNRDPQVRPRLRAARRAADADRGGAFELLRLRRHQRHARFPHPLTPTRRGGRARSAGPRGRQTPWH